MSFTKRLSNEANEYRHVRPKRGATRRNKPLAGWTKKCVGFVGFLGTFAGVLAALLGLFGHWFGKPNTKIYTDEHLSVVSIDGGQFEFQLALTLINEGEKQDTIRRPQVSFTSDKPIVNYSRDVGFTDKQGDVAFPLILQKDSSVQLTCVIKWKPTEDYPKWTSFESGESQEIQPAVMGRIEMAWPGRNQKPIERPFALLAAETIQKMKPGASLLVDYLYLDDDPPDAGEVAPRSAVPSTFSLGLQDPVYRAASIEMDGTAHIAPTRMLASPAQTPKTHYAVQGEIASGKEVSSSNPNEVVVNIRPCGGAGELVVFTAQFRKRLLGWLPCGVQMVQVEKL